MLETADTAILATFDYLRDPPTDTPGERLTYITENQKASTIRLVSHEMPIHDARPDRPNFSLDVQGFALVDHKSAITDFSNQQAIEQQYAAEMAELVKQVTGADAAMAFGVNIRYSKAPSNFVKKGDDQPARHPHADFTDASSESVINAMKALCPDYKRAAVFNIWRAFSPPPQSFPLAVVDARTISADQEEVADVRIDVEGTNATEAVMMVYRHSPDHKWYYFSDMEIEEALMFKAFDTDKSRTQRVPHSSFINPLAGPDAPPRASIEARAVAFFR